MKAVILAGGLGTRLSEETSIKPKPMVEIGGKPILWHILKSYSAHGINDFVICCGYKGYVIKEFFANYFLHSSDVTFDMQYNTMQVHERHAEPWKVTLVDTGDATMTGGRLKRVPLAEVLYFKAELKYVTLRTASESHVMDGALSDLEQRLGERFLRIHRNALVARSAVRELERHAATSFGELDGEPAEASDSWAVRIAHVDEWLAVSRRQVAAVREALAGQTR